MAASTKEKPVLQFKNPVFKEGVNVTVWHGDKWLHKVAVGDTVSIAETDGDTLGAALVVGLLYMPARLIPLEVLELEHDPKCRTRDGLFEVMKEVYPDFTIHSPCTVVLFVDPESVDQPAPPKPKDDKPKGKGGGKGKGKGGGKPAGAGKPEGTPTGKPEGAGKPEGTEKPAGDEAPKENPDKDAPDPAPTPDTEPSTDAGGEKSQG